MSNVYDSDDIKLKESDAVDFDQEALDEDDAEISRIRKLMSDTFGGPQDDDDDVFDDDILEDTERNDFQKVFDKLSTDSRYNWVSDKLGKVKKVLDTKITKPVCDEVLRLRKEYDVINEACNFNELPVVSKMPNIEEHDDAEITKMNNLVVKLRDELLSVRNDNEKLRREAVARKTEILGYKKIIQDKTDYMRKSEKLENYVKELLDKINVMNVKLQANYIHITDLTKSHNNQAETIHTLTKEKIVLKKTIASFNSKSGVSSGSRVVKVVSYDFDLKDIYKNMLDSVKHDVTSGTTKERYNVVLKKTYLQRLAVVKTLFMSDYVGEFMDNYVDVYYDKFDKKGNNVIVPYNKDAIKRFLKDGCDIARANMVKNSLFTFGKYSTQHYGSYHTAILSYVLAFESPKDNVSVAMESMDTGDLHFFAMLIPGLFGFFIEWFEKNLLTVKVSMKRNESQGYIGPALICWYNLRMKRN